MKKFRSEEELKENIGELLWAIGMMIVAIVVCSFFAVMLWRMFM